MLKKYADGALDFKEVEIFTYKNGDSYLIKNENHSYVHGLPIAKSEVVALRNALNKIIKEQGL